MKHSRELRRAAYAGWNGVCLLGAGISALTIAFWAATLRATPSMATGRTTAAE
ncbi:hypothetical protein [Bosea sp. 685]|uniref:hypothetical protein n=1 Tax=Bosea sp. 685 TaxID=3080057 RepID=UPI0028936E20|nr:hypothetical protein [Bosea sp. 685]WNJ93357.1 hypothetical protein RMR04_14145 [Bosea sp. 685]